MDGFLFDIGRDEEPQGRGYSPRDYQVDADHRTYARLMAEEAMSAGIYVATGLGKTEIAALLIQREHWPRKGRVFLTPRRELVVQSAERLRSRGVPCGIEMAECRSDEVVTVGCYQSFQSRNRFERYLATTGLLIVDESHLNYTPKAIEMIRQFKSWGTKVVGMTATPKTGKKDPLLKHYGDPSFVYGYLDGQRDGWLVPAKLYLCILDDLDLSEWSESWKPRAGESDETLDGRPKGSQAVGRHLARRSNVTAVCGMIDQYWEGLPSVVFAMTIAHAEEIQRELLVRNIPCSIVHSRMDDYERQDHLRQFESGRTNVIVNVGCLTLGWDSPRVRKLFIARPTKSQALYIQMFGRGTRCEPGLVDRFSTAAQRLAAIAASSKPWMEVYDFTDTSRHCDLKSAMDVLHPELDPRLLMRVRNRIPRVLTPSAATTLDTILEEERQALAREDAEKERMEYEARMHLTGRASLTAYERSITADAESPDRRRVKDYWWMPYGRHRGRGFKKIHEADPHYLPAILPHIRDEGLARNIRRFLSTRLTG